jgi:hypothetical protein
LGVTLGTALNQRADRFALSNPSLYVDVQTVICFSETTFRNYKNVIPFSNHFTALSPSTSVCYPTNRTEESAFSGFASKDEAMGRINLTAAVLLGLAFVFSCLMQKTTFAWQAAQQNAAPQVSAGDAEIRTSRVYTFVDKTGLGHQHAVEGWLKPSRLLLNAKENAGRLVFDMQSFDADTDPARKFIGLEGSTSESTRQQVNQNMKGRDILDTQRYPESTFVVNSSLHTGKYDSKNRPEYELRGEFTLHGVTKPLLVKCYIEKARGWIRILGQFEIKQTEYGIKPFSKAFGAIGVADALRIHGAIWLAPPENFDLSHVPEIK